MEKPQYFDYITKRCLVACSKEIREINMCTCVNDGRRYMEAMKEYEEYIKNNGSVTQ